MSRMTWKKLFISHFYRHRLLFFDSFDKRIFFLFFSNLIVHIAYKLVKLMIPYVSFMMVVAKKLKSIFSRMTLMKWANTNVCRLFFGYKSISPAGLHCLSSYELNEGIDKKYRGGCVAIDLFSWRKIFDVGTQKSEAIFCLALKFFSWSVNEKICMQIKITQKISRLFWKNLHDINFRAFDRVFSDFSMIKVDRTRTSRPW